MYHYWWKYKRCLKRGHSRGRRLAEEVPLRRAIGCLLECRLESCPEIPPMSQKRKRERRNSNKQEKLIEETTKQIGTMRKPSKRNQRMKKETKNTSWSVNCNIIKVFVVRHLTLKMRRGGGGSKFPNPFHSRAINLFSFLPGFFLRHAIFKLFPTFNQSIN